ncbi:MAG: glycosyltransferase family 4 protein [Planctomycetota bacterium]|jgi:glycosyltransferase involved in cell wall biosynthesis
MKVLHINTERTWRGGEQQNLYLAAGLRDLGEESEVIAQPGSPLAEKAREKGLVVHEVRMRGEWDLAAVRQLKKLYRERKADLVHMHTSHAHTIGCLAARGGGPLTAVSRRVDFSIYRNFLKLSRYKYLWLGDRYIAISKAVRDVLVRDGIPADRIEVVFSGIDVARLDVPMKDLREDLGLPPGTPLVGDVAAFGWHKAQEVLVEAVPHLLKEVPDAHVALIGDGKCMEKVKEVARSLGEAGERVHFCGFRDDVPEVLPSLDLFVMSSVLEGLCTSVLDSQAVGVPVVASAVGGLVEAVADEETGLLVPAKDPEALGAAMARLLRDRDLAKRFGEAGKRRVREQFSVKSMVEGTRSVYGRMLAGEPVKVSP